MAGHLGNPKTDRDQRRKRSKWLRGAIPLAAATLLTTIFTLAQQNPSGADDSGGFPADFACGAPQAGYTQIAFPIGGVNLPDETQLTDEYANQALVFSDDDSDLPGEQKKAVATPGTYNIVRQATLGNVYRMNFANDDVREAKVVMSDGNLNQTIHKLTAFDANDNVVDTAEYRDWLNPGFQRFFLSVQANVAIKSVVVTQASFSGASMLAASSLTCVDFGTYVAPSTTTTLATTTTTPPVGTNCGSRVATANADAWVMQSDASANKGDDSSLKVQSKSGSDAFRTLVNFALPAIPAGCEIDRADLQLFASGVKSGRTLVAQPVSTTWSEPSVNWANQPAAVGASATAASGTSAGWRSWSVGSQVAAMYAGTNNGFVIRDNVENQDAEQVFNARESGQNAPRLSILLRPSSDTTTTTTVAPTTTVVPTTTTTVVPTTTTTVVPTTTTTAAPATTTTTSAPSNCGQRTLVANADTWLSQSNSTSNNGGDSSLKVQSKSGNDAFRALVNFALPAIPTGCVIDSADLRLYADSAKSGRNIQVFRAGAPWSENAATWANQPKTTGSFASVTSGSSSGWRTWSVGSQVAGMYSTGQNYGFLVRDAVENQDSEQVFNSREKGQNIPTLIIRFRPA